LPNAGPRIRTRIVSGWKMILVRACSLLLCCLPLPRVVMTVDTKSIHATEVQDRPPRTWRQIAHAILYFFVFNLGNFTIVASQIVFLLPLRLLPFVPAKSLYDAGIRFSKGAFGTLLGKCLSPPLLMAPIEWTDMSSSYVSMVRTFSSRYHLRTRWPGRVLDG
jgi:hypothetical protein